MRTRWWLLLLFCSVALTAAATLLFSFGYVMIGIYDTPRANRGVEESEQRRVAVHEAGHAVVAAHLTGVDEIERITVFATLPETETYGTCHTVDHYRLETADDIMREAAVFMGGRAADTVVNGGATTGAGSDLGHVNDIIWNMHLVSGLGGSLMVRSRSEAPAAMVQAVEGDINATNACAEAVVRANRDLIVLLADRIMRQPVSSGSRTLSGEDFRAFIAEHPISPPPENLRPTLMTGCIPAPPR